MVQHMWLVLSSWFGIKEEPAGTMSKSTKKRSIRLMCGFLLHSIIRKKVNSFTHSHYSCLVVMIMIVRHHCVHNRMRETELWRLREGQRERESEQKFFFDFVLLIFNLLSAFHSLRNKTIIHMLNLLLLLFQLETNKYVKHYINKTSIIFLFFFLLFLSLFSPCSFCQSIKDE